MKAIEVEWKVTPQSGLTEIPFFDLNVKNEKEWNDLEKSEQEKRINKYLEISESYIKAVAINW